MSLSLPPLPIAAASAPGNCRRGRSPPRRRQRRQGMMVQRHLTKRLRDPGSDRVFCAPPSPPRRVLGGGDDNNADLVARGLSSSEKDPSWLRSCAGRRHRCCRWGETGEGARRLAEALAGVRRTSIEDGRYKAGWTRLSAGGRKRRTKASAAGTGTGSRGRGVSSGVAGDGDAWAPGDPATARQMPLHHVSERGVSPPAPRRSLRTRGRRWLKRWGLK
jgi:hypothetical protein